VSVWFGWTGGDPGSGVARMLSSCLPHSPQTQATEPPCSGSRRGPVRKLCSGRCCKQLPGIAQRKQKGPRKEQGLDNLKAALFGMVVGGQEHPKG
jgi:hypothetical protein